MANKEIVGWFTVNGNHIPIMKGEGKMQALGRFIKKKQKDKVKDRDYDMYWNAYDKAKKQGHTEDEAERIARDYAEEKYGKNWDRPGKNTTIKGEGTQKFKANNALAKQNEVEDKYWQKASEVMDKANKATDKDMEEIRAMREAGASRSKIREAHALSTLNYNLATNERNRLQLTGDYEGLKAYNEYMDKPMKYKLKEDKENSGAKAKKDIKGYTTLQNIASNNAKAKAKEYYDKAQVEYKKGQELQKAGKPRLADAQFRISGAYDNRD